MGPRRQIACGPNHAVIATDKGVVFGWGSTEHGQFGEVKGNPKLIATECSTLDEEIVLRKVGRQQKDPSPELSGVAVESVGCEERATVLVHRNGHLEEWRDEKKTILWGLEAPVLGTLLPKAAFVACGSNHSLVIDELGRLWSWGANTHGELGLGDMQHRATPTLIQSLEKIVVSNAAAGAKHSLCCTQEGDVYAFGYNERGQLGTGNQIGQASPTLVNALQKTIRSVACGASHSAAISEDGRLYMFGAGSYGRCGHGYEGDVYSPVENETLARLGRVAMCSLGELHSACVMDTGKLFVWGSGMYNKLGLGDDTSNKSFPTELNSHLGLFSSVACGPTYTVGVLKYGQTVSWGSPSSSGRLGRNLSTDPTRPNVVDGIPTEETVGVFAVVSADGEGVKAAEPISAPIMKAHVVKQIATGSFHSLLLTHGGVVFGFGSNVFGQCGVHHTSDHFLTGSASSDLGLETSAKGTTENNYIKTPKRIQVSEGTVNYKISFIACGSSHSMVITTKGALYTFGNGSSHQLGLGMISNKFTPTLVSSLSGNRIELVAGGESHSACITREGSLYMWGSSDSGKLGLGKNVETLVATPALVHIGLELGDRVVSVSCASSHTLIVTKKGKLFSCGAGFYGRLGTGKVRNEPDPVLVTFEGEEVVVTEASAGDLHSVCVSKAGDLYVWGIGDARLGLGDTSDKLIPTKNSKFSNPCYRAVAADTHTLVLTTDGSVWAFGKNSYGKLGLGSDPRDCSSPERIKPEIMQLGSAPDSSLDRDIRSLASSSNHSLALSRDGRVFVWGAAGQGRLGLPSVSVLAEVVSPRRLDELDLNEDSAISSIANASHDVLDQQGPESVKIVSATSSSMLEIATSMIAAFKLAVAQNSSTDDRLFASSSLDSFVQRDVIPPIGAIQLYVKSKQKPQYSDQSLKQQLKACFDGEAVNLHGLRQFVRKQGELTNLEMTIAFAVEHIAKAVANKNFFPVARTPQSVLAGVSQSISSSSQQTVRAKRRWSKRNSEETTAESQSQSRSNSKTSETKRENQETVIVSQHLFASLPFLERVMSLLLINPGLVYGFYEKLVLGSGTGYVTDRSDVKWSDLFVGLCRDLYSLQDPHSERLLHRLAICIARNEVESAKSFFLYSAEFQRKSVFRRLFELFLTNQPKLGALIKRRLRAEFVPFVKSTQLNEAVLRTTAFAGRVPSVIGTVDGNSSSSYPTSEKVARDLSEIGVKVFSVFETIISEIILQDFQGIGRICYDFYALLLSKFANASSSSSSSPTATSSHARMDSSLGKGAAAAAGKNRRDGTIMDDRDVQNHIALFVARFLYQTLFEPVLKEPSKFGLDDPLEAVADEDFPDMATRETISKFLMHSLTMPVSGEGTTTTSFEASVAAYQRYVRGAFEIRSRLEMDAKLIEARTNLEKQKEFEAQVEEKRQQIVREASKIQAQGGDVPVWIKAMDGQLTSVGTATTSASDSLLFTGLREMDDVFRPLREQGVRLIRQELKRMASLSLEIDSVELESLDVAHLAALADDTLDINLLIDLAKEHLRIPKAYIEPGFDRSLNKPLVVYPTRRTLEFIKFVVFPPFDQEEAVAVAGEENGIREEKVEEPNSSKRTVTNNNNTGRKPSSPAYDRQDVVFSSQGEWEVLQELVRGFEREFGQSFRVGNFEGRVQELDDDWGIAMMLDLRRLDLNLDSSSSSSAMAARIIFSQTDGFDRLSNLTRLDTVTRTPIPVQLVKDRDSHADVLGLEKITSSVGSDVLDMRDILCALPQLPVESTTPDQLSAMITQETSSGIGMRSIEYREAFKKYRDNFPGGEDLTRLFLHVVEEVEFRERSIAKLSALRRAHENLKEQIDLAMKSLNDIARSLKAFALVLRDRDTSRNHQQVRDIARRKGKAYRLTELPFVRSIQIRGVFQGSSIAETNSSSTNRGGFWSSLTKCFGKDEEEVQEILERKRQLSAHNLVRGAFVSQRYQQLKDLDVITEVISPSGPFGRLHPNSECPSIAGKVSNTGDCVLSDEQLRKHWPKITKRLVFHLFLTDTARFAITLVYNAVTVIATVEDHISSLLTRARSFSLDWHPNPRFPFKFRVQRLLAFIQEMSLQSFM